MKKQKSMMDHMRSRNAMANGDPIVSKKLEASPTSISKPTLNTPNLQKTLESPNFVKRKAEVEKKIRRKESLRNLGKWALGTAGTAAGLVAGYYGLTEEAGGKEIKDASGRVTGKTPKYRKWLWEK